MTTSSSRFGARTLVSELFYFYSKGVSASKWPLNLLVGFSACERCVRCRHHGWGSIINFIVERWREELTVNDSNNLSLSLWRRNCTILAIPGVIFLNIVKRSTAADVRWKNHGNLANYIFKMSWNSLEPRFTASRKAHSGKKGIGQRW